MKKAIVLLLLMFSALTAFAAPAKIAPSELAPHFGFVRKSPCSPNDTPTCGDNPPTFQITVEMCGLIFSTSAARNQTGGTVSTKGIKYLLPTVAMFSAAGYSNAGGGDISGGVADREGFCELHFVMGAPGPENYLRIGLQGVSGVDKFTSVDTGAADFHYGEVVFPYLTPGVLTIAWNGTSWLAKSGSPAILERMFLGQLFSHGQGRLFKVTADPSWWTSDTRVGSLAYCPRAGRGIVGASNGGFQLQVSPHHCTFLNPDLSTGTDWIGWRWIGSANVESIAAGAAYLAGTAPDGQTYLAGNYIVLIGSTFNGLVSGNTVEVRDLEPLLGSVVRGKWIAKMLVAGVDPGCPGGKLCIELHQSIDDGNGTNDTVAVGPPSSFVAGDSIATTVTALNFSTLVQTGIATARFSNPVNSVDVVGSNRNTIVGVARRTAANGWEDSATVRGVASAFNPVERECLTTYSTDRTTTSLTYVTVNTEITCNFAYFSGVNKQAADLGDKGRGVKWTLNATVSNNTASDGCQVTVSFNGAAAESKSVAFLNPAGESGNKYALTVSGTKEGLSDGLNTVTVQAKALTGGTCTLYSDGTSLVTTIWQ